MYRYMKVVLVCAVCSSFVVLAGCAGGDGAFLFGKSSALIGPAAISHEATGGTEGFFFLPPIAPDPSPGGTFDATLASDLEVEVVDLDLGTTVVIFTDTATTNSSETIRVNADDEHYIVNFHTDLYDLPDGQTCRIFVRRKSDGAVYGFADVQVFANMKEAKSLVDDTTFALKDGRTLPVKFRIEQHAEPAVLLLYEKDSNWNIVEGGASGVLAYCPSGPTFDYFFDGGGLQADTEYNLIYYADPWPGNNPGALIASGMADGSGNIQLAGSIDLGMDLPQWPDENLADGAKIWLVPSSDYNLGTNAMTGWNTTEYLFEDRLITYDDTDVNG